MSQAVCACVPGLLLYVDIGLRLGPIYNYMLCLCWAVGPGHAIFLLGSNVVKKCWVQVLFCGLSGSANPNANT